MKKIYSLLGTLTLFISGTAIATGQCEQSSEVIKEIKSANSRQFCTYKNELYGPGSVIEMGTTVMTCVKNDYTDDLEWQSRSK